VPERIRKEVMKNDITGFKKNFMTEKLKRMTVFPLAGSAEKSFS